MLIDMPILQTIFHSTTDHTSPSTVTMLFRAVVAATAFTGLVLAQNSSTQTSQYTVPASEIDANTRSTWCTSQQNICNPICGGLAYPNTCDPVSLPAFPAYSLWM